MSNANHLKAATQPPALSDQELAAIVGGVGHVLPIGSITGVASAGKVVINPFTINRW